MRHRVIPFPPAPPPRSLTWVALRMLNGQTPLAVRPLQQFASFGGETPRLCPLLQVVR
jgi:hypothetical protein